MDAYGPLICRVSPTLGLLFELLVVRDLRVYADAMRTEVFHYHDVSGLEADAVAVAPNGEWGAFEVKLSPSVVVGSTRTTHASRLCVIAHNLTRACVRYSHGFIEGVVYWLDLLR